jgi:3-deoxy-D-manno-octulosonic-acid transferase
MLKIILRAKHLSLKFQKIMRITSASILCENVGMNRFIYSLILFLALPFVPLKLLWRGIKQPAYRQHWGERFGFYDVKISKPVIWLHCVSVGETRAAEPLIKSLQTQYPNHQILLTHGTPTGRDASEGIFGNLVTRVYLPYDLPFAVNGFLKHFQPKIGLIMETELWFNLIAACQHKQIPLLLLNARLSEKSFNGYQKLGKLAREGLQSLSAIAAQNVDDAAHFTALGASNVSIAGNLKFDVKPPAWAAAEAQILRENLGKKRTVFLAASTREGEEELILAAVKDLDVLTIIVPRHPQRFDFVANLLQKNNLNFMWRTDLQASTYPDARNEVAAKTVPADCKFVIGNSMGEMFTYYGACDFCFIGGSLLPLGGQNLIEAAAVGKPILIGEHTFNFADASNSAVNAGAAIRVHNARALQDNIKLLRDDLNKRQNMQQAALKFSQQSTGATAKTMQLIAQFL